MATSVYVPSELVETILDGLDGDIITLRRCALVDHVFFSHSQKLLFKRISLGSPSEKEMAMSTLPAAKFYDHITKLPHLRKYVLELAISDDWIIEHAIPNDSVDVEHTISDNSVIEPELAISDNSVIDLELVSSFAHAISDDFDKDRSWLRTDEKIGKILPLLGGLEGLVIGACRLSSFYEWSPDLQSAILTAVPSLAGLSLLGLSVPLQILNDVPKLKNLTLVDVSFMPDELEIPAPSTSPKAVLEIFNITTSYGQWQWSDIGLWLQAKDCALDMTHLTTLNIKLPTMYTDLELNSSELKVATWLIYGCANTLRELHISFPPEVTCPPDYDGSYIALESLPNLQKLSLEGRLWDGDTCDRAQNAFTWLVNVLGRIQPNNSLNHVHLSLMTVDWKRFTQKDYAEAPWDDLIQTLLRLEEFASISVEFSIYDVRGPYIEDILKERIAPLSERGMATLSSTGNYSGDMSDDDELLFSDTDSDPN